MSARTDTLGASFLIQRLNAPSTNERMAKLAGAFSFGGGLRNGGLSDEAMGLLRTIFSFDYMGAAEFEWGAVPEALNKIAKAKKLQAFTVQTPDGPVYVIAPKAWRDEVTDRVTAFASSTPPRTKERVGLHDSLTSDDARTRGWLELNNGFFFFTDADMHAKTAELFGCAGESGGSAS